MKATVQLDYPAILANSAQPVHLAFHFTAPGHSGHRAHPITFSFVLDRSGSISGEPLTSALRAEKTVAQNLRREATRLTEARARTGGQSGRSFDFAPPREPVGRAASRCGPSPGS